MTAVATRPRIAKAKPIDTAPAIKVTASDFDSDAAALVLQRASSISGFLMNIFGNGTSASPREIRELTGLMGTVQHLHRILKDLENEVTEFDGDLPAFFCNYLTEASHMATLIDEIEWRSGYEFHMGNGAMSSYFDAICSCCDAAEAALVAEAVQS